MKKSDLALFSLVVAANSFCITPALANQDVIASSFTTQGSSLQVPHNYIAQARKAFTVTYIWSGTRDINIKSSATGKVYNVQYASPIGAEVGDTVTVIIDDSDRWITIINERTGRSAAITDVTRR